MGIIKLCDILSKLGDLRTLNPLANLHSQRLAHAEVTELKLEPHTPENVPGLHIKVHHLRFCVEDLEYTLQLKHSKTLEN